MNEYDVKTAERFINKINFEYSDSDCWNWVGAKNTNGYGNIRYRGKMWKAHRISYMLFNGELSDGMVVDHLCKNRGCVNPLHLEEVLQKENLCRILRQQASIAQLDRATDF
jgi:hypothetical protein